MTVTTLASGSSGNCTLVSQGKTHVLVDAGISCRRIAVGLKALGLGLEDLTALCVTHEHSDHIAGVATLTKRRRLPVFASPGTARQLNYRVPFLEELLRPVEPGVCFEIGELVGEGFPILHDTAQPCGFVLAGGERKAAVVTDLGEVTDDVLDAVQGADLLLAEANHDVEWLMSGPYPYPLKERILGPTGHLSNEAGANLARVCVERGARTVLLGHLSAENNSPARALDVARSVLGEAGVRVGRDVTLAVAPRGECSPVYEV